MKDNSPKISIITPSYNSEKYIEKAIKSVLNQNYNNYEHIIVDGGSTDKTLNIIKNYSHLTVISEPDDGIYDALNKGLQESTGELIGWLNSDDLYAGNAFDKLINEYLNQPNSDIIAGACEVFKTTNSKKKMIKELEFTHPPIDDNHNVKYTGTRLNGCFLTKDLVECVGRFDSSLMIAGDADYLIRIMTNNPKIAIIQDLVYRYRAHDESLTFTRSTEFDQVTETWMNEAMRFMIGYAKNKQLPDPLREYCLSSFRGRSGILFKEYIKQGRFKSALRTATYCIRHDALWPAWMAKKFVNKYVIQEFK